MRKNCSYRYFACCWVLLLALMPVSNAQTSSEWNARGADAYEAENWSEAVEAFQKAYSLDRTTGTIQANLVNSVIMFSQELAQTGNHAVGIEWLESAIKVAPENVNLLNQLGAYLLITGDVSSAIFRLEESIELDAEDINAHFLLGEAYYKDNDVTAAIDQWEWVYKVDPEYGGLQTRLENALREEQVVFDFEGDQSRNFNVTFDREAEGQLVKDVLRILEEAYKEIGRSLGGIYPPTPIQVSLYTTEGFSESTQMGQHVGALFDGTKIRCPVLDRNGKSIPLDVLRERLYHEYVHVVVHHSTNGNAQWWFNEGLAETLSTNVSDDEKQMLQAASESRTLFDFETISPQNLLATFEPEELSLAYAQSHVAVLYLKQRYGVRNFSKLFDSLRTGLQDEEALRDAFGMSYFSLSAQVNSSINQF
jgi:tetratricopeptide (TPR) repeat protein